ncbi:hypothetical protein [Geobacillus kaustophilus]|uniref:hypothetical protein n=1 Tax=Geobacillus kaustophilus TaxID=1462 RepID=UPI0005CD7D21|nr:hypothetical protein [Geobacillus kaustophilus]
MVTLFGFNGPAPFSTIFWHQNGEYVSKTICYTEEEEREAISRFYTSNDFYSTFDAAVICREKRGQGLFKTEIRLDHHGHWNWRLLKKTISRWL